MLAFVYAKILPLAKKWRFKRVTLQSHMPTAIEWNLILNVLKNEKRLAQTMSLYLNHV